MLMMSLQLDMHLLLDFPYFLLVLMLNILAIKKLLLHLLFSMSC